MSYGSVVFPFVLRMITLYTKCLRVVLLLPSATPAHANQSSSNGSACTLTHHECQPRLMGRCWADGRQVCAQEDGVGSLAAAEAPPNQGPASVVSDMA